MAFYILLVASSSCSPAPTAVALTGNKLIKMRLTNSQQIHLGGPVN